MVAAGAELVQPGDMTGATGSVSYLVPWGTAASVRFLATALDRVAANVKSTDLAFTHAGAIATRPER